MFFIVFPSTIHFDILQLIKTVFAECNDEIYAFYFSSFLLNLKQYTKSKTKLYESTYSEFEFRNKPFTSAMKGKLNELFAFRPILIGIDFVRDWIYSWIIDTIWNDNVRVVRQCIHWGIPQLWFIMRIGTDGTTVQLNL